MMHIEQSLVSGTFYAFDQRGFKRFIKAFVQEQTGMQNPPITVEFHADLPTDVLILIDQDRVSIDNRNAHVLTTWGLHPDEGFLNRDLVLKKIAPDHDAWFEFTMDDEQNIETIYLYIDHS